MSQLQNSSVKSLQAVNDKPTETLGSSSQAQEVGEIVRDAGVTVAKEVVATLPNMLRSLLGQPLPMDYDPRRVEEKRQEEVYWKEKHLMSESLRQEEVARKLEKQQAQLNRVEQLRETLKSVLTPSVARLAKEIDASLITAKATADVYTEHFLMQMLSMLLKLNKKINNASMWMAAARNRANKRLPFFMTGKNSMQVDAYMSGERAISFGG